MQPRPVPAARGRVGAVVAGLVVAAAVAALRVTGVLAGPAAVALAGVLVLAVPTSRLLARRVLLAGGVLAGLLPALWWWDLPLGPLGRAGLLLALLAGGLAAGALWRGPRAAGSRVRAALPARRRVDLVVLAVASGAAYLSAGWLTVRDGAGALARLLPGWDNSAHVSMVLGLRRHGVITLLADAPADQSWKFTEYPQGFHAVIAAGVELLRGVDVGTSAQEVTGYVQAQGLLMVATATLVAAGLTQVAVAARRPLRTLVVAAGAATVLIAGPGGRAVTDGFGNFVLAAALTAAAFLLAASLPRLTLPLPLVALGGYVVGVAHAWMLLLLVALPAVLMAVVPRGRSWRGPWRGTRGQVAAAAVVALVTAAGLAQGLRIVSSLSAAAVLVTPGGIVLPDVGLLLAVVALTFAAALWPVPGRPARVAWTAAVPVVGSLVALGLGVVQLRQGGELSYYFWKLVLGLALVCAVVLAHALLWFPAGRPWPGGRARLAALAASAATLLAATQVFGLQLRPEGRDPGLEELGETLLAAVDRAEGITGPVTHVSTAGLHPVNRQQWFLALRGTWTNEANAATALLLDGNGFPLPQEPALAALLADPDRTVVLTAADAAALLEAPDDVADRLATW